MTESHRELLRQRKRRRLWLLVGITIIAACIFWQVNKNQAANDAAPAVSKTETQPVNQSPLAETVIMAATPQITPSATPLTTPQATPISAFKPTASPSLAATPTASPSPSVTPLVSSPSGITPSETPTHEPSASPSNLSSLPEGFVRVSERIPGIHIDMRYFGSNNFMGRPASGYEGNVAILTEKACSAFAKVDTALKRQGFGLIIYDAYRPTRAVSDFVLWAKDLDDTTTKADYYPDIEKESILNDGYIAAKSSHSRGSTVDLSIVSLETGKPPDMGCSFDFFGKEADPDYGNLSELQRTNRDRLRKAMEKEGFVISSIEWWHFRLKNEPFPNTSFDFPVR